MIPTVFIHRLDVLGALTAAWRLGGDELTLFAISDAMSLTDEFKQLTTDIRPVMVLPEIRQEINR